MMKADLKSGLQPKSSPAPFSIGWSTLGSKLIQVVCIVKKEGWGL